MVVIGLAADSGCGKSTFMRRMTSIFGGAPKPPVSLLSPRLAVAGIGAVRKRLAPLLTWQISNPAQGRHCGPWIEKQLFCNMRSEVKNATMRS